VIARRHRWLLCASGDAALCVLLAALFGLHFLYALAPLSFPLWAWLDGRAEGRALLDRLFGD
jgi:hypothetical protein